MYRAVILPTMLYGSEIWVPYRRHTSALNKLQQRHLRQLLRIKWYHHVSNVSVLKKASCESAEVMITKSRLRWAGHVCRMQENRLPKSLLYGELVEGKRKPGGQLKRYKDVCHENLKGISMQHQWEEAAHNRTQWRRIVNSVNNEKPKK